MAVIHGTQFNDDGIDQPRLIGTSIELKPSPNGGIELTLGTDTIRRLSKVLVFLFTVLVFLGLAVPVSAEPIDFPERPAYIKLIDEPRITVDFSRIVDDHPQISLPIDFFRFLPMTEDGNPILPDNFCGLRVRQPSRFVWLKQGKEFNKEPFNNVPEESSVYQMFGDDYYLGGIEFTGPIGKCSDSSENWQFPFPFTKTNKGPSAPDYELLLVIELEHDSEIEFLNYNLKSPEGLSLYEIYSRDWEGKFLEVIELLNKVAAEVTGEEYDSYCSIDRFMHQMCEQAKEDGKPRECLIRGNYESPC
jgi:hypothetical protein